MNFLPVMQRELALAARRPGLWRARSAGVVVAGIAGFGLLYASFAGVLTPVSAGKNLFWALSALGYAYALFYGAFCTADCLSQEKREGTLGLLFLTDLKARDIIAGKLASGALRPAYALISALPVIGLAMFMGGVGGAAFLKMMAALVNTLFFGVSVGILISALCWGEQTALNLSLFLAAGLGAALPGAGFAFQNWMGAAAPPPVFFALSPAGAFLAALDSVFAWGLGLSFAPSFWMTHLAGWAALAAAAVILPRTWKDRTRAVWKAWKTGDGGFFPRRAGRSRFDRQGWLEVNPGVWLGGRGRGMGMGYIFALIGAAWAAGALLYKNQWFDLPVYIGTAAVLHVSLMYAVALQACRGPAEDRRSGALELLLTTPLGGETVVSGRLLSLKRQAFIPAALTLGADAFLIWAGGEWLSGWEFFFWLLGFAAFVFMLFMNLYTLAWVGVWQGLRLGRTARAVGQTLYYVIFLRWLLLAALLPIPGILTQGEFFRSEGAAVFAVAAYLILLLASVLHFCGLAMDDLRSNLRALALGEAQEKGWFSWRVFPPAPRPHGGALLRDSVGVMQKRPGFFRRLFLPREAGAAARSNLDGPTYL